MRSEEDEYDNDDFVVDDEEEPDWRQALKSVTRYDPSKYVIGLMLSQITTHYTSQRTLGLKCIAVHGCLQEFMGVMYGMSHAHLVLVIAHELGKDASKDRPNLCGVYLQH